MDEIEEHPFAAFVPENATVLIVGSFPGKEITHKTLSENEWFYEAKRNQFWKIISGVYHVELNTRAEKEALFKKHGIGIVDIFLRIKRKGDNNTDSNLQIVEYNEKAIAKILQQKNIRTIFFTSQFVEKSFLKLFPHVKNGTCLPSPSPRYARMSLSEKIEKYKSVLPQC
jgi:hypoxanthine-DNA glycosylase